jgi:hypothetical protein
MDRRIKIAIDYTLIDYRIPHFHQCTLPTPTPDRSVSA